MNPAQHVCNYAVLRFLPYPETGEFVNVGVVAHCEELGWLGYAGVADEGRRVTQFFPAVIAADYLRQRTAMFAELERVRVLISNTKDRRLACGIFQELVRPRESVFRFGEIRTAMTADPAELVTRLCEHYVKPKTALGELVSG